jgi:Na+/H+ antiporter NhaD/arsenite permease-like protein
MLGGALAVLLTGQITPSDAFHAINPDVMVFLFGMFVVGEALVESGYFSIIAHRFFSRVQNRDQLVFMILMGFGILSAILMNDTIAIIGTPVVLWCAARFRVSPKLMLLTLAVAITTGSVMSPIGNPQNLLVAINSGMAAPFITFGVFLVIPTFVNLGIAFFILRFFYRDGFQVSMTNGTNNEPHERDPHLACIVRISLLVIIALIIVNIASSLTESKLLVSLPLIAACAAAPILVFSTRRVKIFTSIDWQTLIFFAAMFVLMESVWQTGFFQTFITGSQVSSIPSILATSVIISQFISNVPFVALFLPLINTAGGTLAQFMALAAGSTIAGNLLILGAASNIIIIQSAEKQGETLTFSEFAKVGVPLTILQVLVYWLFLTLV